MVDTKSKNTGCDLGHLADTPRGPLSEARLLYPQSRPILVADLPTDGILLLIERLLLSSRDVTAVEF
jgi:hypothetical protein